MFRTEILRVSEESEVNLTLLVDNDNLEPEIRVEVREWGFVNAVSGQMEKKDY